MLRWLLGLVAPRLVPLHAAPSVALPDPSDAPDLADRAAATLAEVAEAPYEGGRGPSAGRLLLGMGALDLVTREADRNPDTAGRTPNYAGFPAFQPVQIPGADGVVLKGHHSTGAPGAPVVIVVHGLNDSHVSHYVVEHAEVLRRWGFHVFALDMRSHGQLLGAAPPPSLGPHEGRDLFAAARALADKEGVSVGILGLSYGGQCAVRAAHVASAEGRPDVLRGGVMAVCAPLNIHEAVCSLDDPSRLPRLPSVFERLMVREMVRFIRKNMRNRSRHGRPGLPPCESHEMFVREVVIPAYPDALPLAGAYLGAARSSQAKIMGDLSVPTLVLHSDDDPIVPPLHAHEAREAAGDNPMVGVRVVHGGGHVALGYADGPNYLRLLATFFGRLRDG